jgi:alpha-L-fucosidase 2
MLVQSHRGEIHLLPALPKAWPNGSMRGLRARGGVAVDLAWRDGKLVSTELRSKSAQTVKLRYGERTTEVRVAPGEPNQNVLKELIR